MHSSGIAKTAVSFSGFIPVIEHTFLIRPLASLLLVLNVEVYFVINTDIGL